VLKGRSPWAAYPTKTTREKTGRIKMKKINLKDYEVEVRTPTGTNRVNYEVKTSIIGLLFQPELKLNGVELLKQNQLAEKILQHQEPEILLEDAEYNKIKQAIDLVKGFGKNDVELVRRVLEAEDVSVTEVKGDKTAG
jgi:uncharacterized protein YacL (UPF0231 family)